MSNKTIDTEKGHWVLAKMGKKVLRPGGKELTMKMIDNLDINPQDDIVEFAPGMGYTAELSIAKKPKSYTGVELNEEAAALLKEKIQGASNKIIIGNAAKSGLKENTYSKVYGEAMLTMQADHRKSEIIREAHRLLKKGGLYGIHELGLTPNDITSDIKANIQKELAKVIKVNARPLTADEWTTLLENEGFKVLKVDTSPMHLLEKNRMIEDEGFLNTLKIVFNILTHTDARNKILAMRKVFRENESHLNAISIVAKKI